MKKTILTLTFLMMSSIAYAELYWQSIPAVCGTSDDVQNYVNVKELKPVHISLGRESGNPNGEPVYMITYYENEDQTLVTVDIPSAEETCILYHTYNKTEVIN